MPFGTYRKASVLWELLCIKFTLVKLYKIPQKKDLEMKKIISAALICSMAFMGFAITSAQSASFNPHTSTEFTNFDALPFKSELSVNELSQVEGEVGGVVVRVVVAGAKAVARAAKSTRGAGPSGKPKIHNVNHSSKKAAKEAAQHGGQSKPAHHPSPTKGKPHYHSTDKSGNIKKNGVHHNYPRGR